MVQLLTINGFNSKPIISDVHTGKKTIAKMVTYRFWSSHRKGRSYNTNDHLPDATNTPTPMLAMSKKCFRQKYNCQCVHILSRLERKHKNNTFKGNHCTTSIKNQNEHHRNEPGGHNLWVSQNIKPSPWSWIVVTSCCCCPLISSAPDAGSR